MGSMSAPFEAAAHKVALLCADSVARADNGTLADWEVVDCGFAVYIAYWLPDGRMRHGHIRLHYAEAV